VLSIHLIATSFAFFNLANTAAWGQHRKKLFITTGMSRLSCKMGMRMGGTGTKNLFPHISTLDPTGGSAPRPRYRLALRARHGQGPSTFLNPSLCLWTLLVTLWHC